MSGAGDPGGHAARAIESADAPHIPVLLSEVVESLKPLDGDFIIDGTFGAGGYTRAILAAANCRVLAFDRDITAIRDAAHLIADAKDRLSVANAPFSEMEDVARVECSAPSGPFVDGVVLDIGVSSMQLNTAVRGFSFLRDGPLDMRMSDVGATAADFLNAADEEEIANVIYVYGDERRSRAIARAIIRAREERPLSRTSELADIVARVFKGHKPDGKHPATRTFQALRIHINDELGELARGLTAAERILKPGGRLVVVTFHSLEDRIVKRFLQSRAGKDSRGSRHLPEISIKSSAESFRIVNRSPLTPSKGELDLNPRARSARLRAAIRTEAPPWPLDFSGLEVPDPAL